jgi:hypothetical protein
MSFLMVIYVVLMILWLVWGGYSYESARPHALGGTLIPWVCVAILGYAVFGGAR